MDFEWDENKDAANTLKHGVPFAFAAYAFDDPFAVAWQDKRRDYDEVRYIVLGAIRGQLYTVAYTVRGEVTRIINARKGNAREKKIYNRALSARS